MNKIKKDIVAHIQKHHKKYIFGTGVGFGLVIVKIIAISGVLLGMTAIVSRSNTINNENEEIFQAITVFNKMDDLLHQRCPRTHQL
ncbi:TPA: hypothetical protein DCZ39_04670 [Patescibacteria group bacterium]|nr:hypothetical protein [Candidatus Gracilibacteria bacterium]